jgi:hypothetical protein
MHDLERELFRDKRRRTALRRLGSDRATCLICGDTNPHHLAIGEHDHIAGQKHADETVFLCKHCHIDRTELQGEEPGGGSDPRNPFEVIGRWLLGIAEYCELLMVTLRRFGNFLIGLARQGYGSDLSLPERL